MKSPARRPARLPRAMLRALPLALTAALNVQAQVAPNKLDQVMVTATRSKLSLDRVLADTTVLTRADIERQGYGNLVDLLSRQGCFEMVRNGNPGSSSSVFLRGAHNQHTLLLVDGVRMDTQNGSGGAAWEAIPLAQIERVEIVRGAASGIYGSDAVAGVIQIFTRQGGDGAQLELGGALGSLGLGKGDMHLSGRLGDFDYALGAALERASGFNTRPVLNDPRYEPDRDGWSQESFNGRLGWQINAHHRLEALHTQADSDSAYDASAKPAPGVDDRNLHKTQISRALWAAQWTKGLSTEYSRGQSTERYETTSNGRSTYLTETEVRQQSLGASWQWTAGQQINLLWERRDDQLLNSGLREKANGQGSRNQKALAASYLFSQGPWDAQLHVRRDDDSDFGAINTGTLAAGWRPATGWRVWASAGSAFRAPTLYQIFSQYGPKDGGAALKPEHGRNRELGLSYEQGVNRASLTVYNNRIKDLISYDAGFIGQCPAYPVVVPKPATWDGCYGNLARVQLRGVSLQGGTELLGLQWQAGLDWQDPRDLATDKRLGRRAKQLANLRVSKQLQDWTGGVQLRAVGSRFDDHANTRPLGGYALLNLDLGYRVNSQLRLQLNLDNALDKAYQTASGYAQAPRTLMLSVRLNPKL
ncbi:MAG: TonB-dependent receptor plug domain-containing protein [Roseateles asaccharophilus]|uniref:TonB-dependent receptor plug domain-containing protein n=1 Tax=Roseateles asaccharophilus TaxID=582607 RepID=UPI00391BCB89